MATKFMLDPLKESDKEILKKAIETANRKVMPRNREAIFLRSFVLALMKQYKYNKESGTKIKIDRYNLPHFELNKEKDNINIQLAKFKSQPKFIIKTVPKPISLPVKDSIPKPVELAPEVPNPI